MTTSDKPSPTDPRQTGQRNIACRRKDRDKTEELSGGWGMFLFFVLTIVILVGMTFWTQTRQLIPSLADPPSIQVLGPVLQTRFIGGFDSDTEIRTATKTLLLHGAVEIDVGTAVERRITYFNDELCVVGTSRCRRVASR